MAGFGRLLLIFRWKHLPVTMAFQPIVDKMKPKWKTIEHYIVFDGQGEDSFERLIGCENGDYMWVEGPEREPCMLCYTSGTTGNPKGVLYEHRSTMLHAIASLQPAVFDFDATAVMLRSSRSDFGVPTSSPRRS